MSFDLTLHNQIESDLVNVSETNCIVYFCLVTELTSDDVKVEFEIDHQDLSNSNGVPDQTCDL